MLLTSAAVSSVLLILSIISGGEFFKLIFKPGRPNVLLVVVDTLRADRLSQYGHKIETSPGLDALTAQAVLFERAYATSSWTIPSTTSLLTGLHPARHKSLEQGATLNPEIVTMAENLKKAGYATAGFSYNIHITQKHKYNQGFDSFTDYDGVLNAYPDISEMTAQVKSWLGRYDESKPFFLYLQPMNCHGPYKIPEEHMEDLFGRRPKPGFKYYGDVMKDIMWKGKIARRKDVTKSYLLSLKEQYDASIRYSTDQIAGLYRVLRDRGLWDNTLVIFTGDHGEELFEHGGFAHAYTLYDEVIHVPMIIKLPLQKRGARSDAVVSVMDLYPTVMDVTGAAFEHRVDGMSLMPILEERSSGRASRARGEALERKNRPLLLHLAWKGRGVMKGLFTSDFKYIDVQNDYSGVKNRKYLFDLGRDPGERKNIVSKEKKRAEKMHREMLQAWDAYSKIGFEASENVLDEMNVEALKALGYIH